MNNSFLFRLFAVFALLLSGPAILQAQVSLNPGDIAFTGYNANPVNSFSFVVLRPGGLANNTSITFTDVGWDPITSSLTASGSDAFITWTSGSGGVAMFAEVTITAFTGSAPSAIASTGTVSAPTGSFSLIAAGDQVLAFQGAQSAPSFIAAIHMNAETASVGTSGPSSLSAWDDIRMYGLSYSSSRSAIPPGLTNGTNAVMVVSGATAPYTEENFARYNCTGAATNTTIAAVRSAINDRNNWSMSSTTGYSLPSACPFTLTPTPVITSQPSSLTICPGNNATFSAVATNATAYQWQESSGGPFTDITTGGGMYAGFNTAQLTVANAPASLNGRQYRVVITGGTPVTSNAASLSIVALGTWLGTASNNWSAPANWSCGVVPNSATTVRIPAGTQYSPAINIPGAAAGTIIIAPGATLSFAGTGNALSIGIGMSVFGSFNTANGKVIYSGSSQTIPAIDYHDLELTGGGVKTIFTDMLINGTLTLTNGILAIGHSYLTIGSSGSIAGGSANSFILMNGDGILIQQNIGAGGRSGNILFPVGDGTNSYAPVTINNSGTADDFSVRVSENAYAAYAADGSPAGSIVSSNAVNKTWFVEEAVAGGSNVALTLQWTAASELSGFNRNSASLAHFTGGRWNAGPRSAAAGSNPYTISRSGITSFSPFGVGSAGSPLPLSLLEFDGRPDDAGVRLYWSTANERQFSGFEIERSTDSRNFSGIATIAAAGSGSYSYLDADILREAQRYYRLKMLDKDGSYSYSRTLALTVSVPAGQARFSVYPNPATGNETMYCRADGRMPAGEVQLELRDLRGVCVFRTRAEAAAFRKPVAIPVKDLPAGMYQLMIRSELGVTHINVLRN